MAPAISIGAQSFEFIRKNHCFFVDKSCFIKEWWENTDAVTLITRPRRFGKTLNLDMLNCFFSVKYKDRSDLFEGLSIWKENPYRQLQGSFPVIFLSFANIKGNTFEKTKKGILHTLSGLYNTYGFLRNGGHLNKKEQAFFDSVTPDMADDTAVLALQYLSDFMSRHYGKKVLIFMDEYDTPLQEAYVYGYWNEMADFIRSLFNSTFKTNLYMERAVMTGITRISRESIFSDLNNLEIVTATSEKYEKCFGFTEEEVFQALDSFGLSGERETVKKWYDGFTFGNTGDIYNPWSIINYLDKKRVGTYWANTSSNALAGKLIREGNVQTKIVMEELLAGGMLETEIDEEIVFEQLQKKHGAIWSLLLAGGYLTAKQHHFSPETGKPVCTLALTNLEVRIMFEDMIRDWFADEDVPYNEFLKALLAGNVEYMNTYMNQVAQETFSTFDTGKKPSWEANPERFYHGFVLGLMAELGRTYRITSNRESGFGRYDVMMEPYKKDEPAFILEFKVHRPGRGKTMEDTLRDTLKQIEDKNYDRELLARGIPKENIRHYGFVFEGKTVLIG